ncbi:MAG: transcriptional regulator [Xanthobacteraceae bacterium]|jgi:transcriptional regulator with XRE-family HTH domain|nr:transcriptional regulator [Xanthobacteraceae bacterium]
MSFRYDEIGNRLKAFRIASGLSADEIASRIGISRTALYRLEKGELVKLDTLEKLSELLEVSIPSLLGVGIEYVASAVAYFERTRQIEETAEQISILSGPISLLLSSDKFVHSLDQVLRESIPDKLQHRARALEDIAKIMAILQERRKLYRLRKPPVVNLISALGIERFLRNGFVGRPLLPESVLEKRRQLAWEEVEHFASVIEEEAIGVQVGLVTDTIPYTGFQIFRQADRKILTMSPFRLGEQPNVRIGIAMITSAPEALSLHEEIVQQLWKGALKGKEAAGYLRALLESNGPDSKKNVRRKSAR